MIRNLKILIVAAMALVVFAEINASGAQAAEFHCSVEPCTVTVKPDGKLEGEGKTAHHVFVVKKGIESISFTCDQVTGHATSATKTFNTLTLTGIAYHHCTTTGQPFNIRMNGCQYHFVVGGVHDATAEVRCLGSEKIELEIAASKCLVTIGSTEVLGGGFTFKDAETGGVKRTEITVEPKISNVPATVGAGCPISAGAGTGEYTTGNVELTAEEDEVPFTHLKFWWE